MILPAQGLKLARRYDLAQRLYSVFSVVSAMLYRTLFQTRVEHACVKSVCSAMAFAVQCGKTSHEGLSRRDCSALGVAGAWLTHTIMMAANLVVERRTTSLALQSRTPYCLGAGGESGASLLFFSHEATGQGPNSEC